MRPGCLFALPLLLSASLAARAGSIATFTFGGQSVVYGMAGDTNTVSGTTVIDTATGQVQSISFVADGLAFSGVTSQDGAEVFVGPSNAAFSFSVASLINYTGSTFNLRGANDLYVGSLTSVTSAAGDPIALPAAVIPSAAAITPEPESLVLLGTGLLAIARLARRKPESVPH